MNPEFRASSAIGHVLQSLFGNIGFAFRFSWPWMAFVLAVQIIAILLFPGLNSSLASGRAIIFTLPPQFLVVIAVTYIANFVAFSSMAVNWHRFILLDEEAQGWDRLRLDAVVLAYMGNTILAQLILMAIMVLGALALFTVLGATSYLLPKVLSGLITGLATLAFGLWSLAALQRIMVKLPAVAVERRDYGFRAAWDDTKGHNLGLIGFLFLQVLIVLLAALPLAVLSYPMGFYSDNPPAWSELAQACLVFPLNWLVVILGVTSLTTLYGIFGEGRAV